MKNVHYFFGGYLSQWYPVKMSVGKMYYSCCEQFMMYCKAYIFQDTKIANQIMATNDPKEQKALGRLIKNFDKDVWDSVCDDVVYLGNASKYSQHNWLLNQLKSTSPKLLAESNPQDSIWGIGMTQWDAERLPEGETWPGQNKLGMTLTKIRDTFINEPTAVERQINELYTKIKTLHLKSTT